MNKEKSSKSMYFDYMATTPVDPRVAEKMSQHLTADGVFGNASSSHAFGLAAKEAIAIARSQVASLINADSREIIWTSGATEANNLALKGAMRFYRDNGKHIVTLATEHKSVLDTCKSLEKEGFTVTYVLPQANGLVDIDAVTRALRPDTVLLSVMHANHEIGVIQDISALGRLARSRGIIFHVDAAQSAGKIAIDLQQLDVDLMSFSAHKLYGPKGVGALFVRRQPRIHLQPLVDGGGQEHGLRSGTLPTHQIVGMGEAFALAEQHMAAEAQQFVVLRQRFYAALKELDGVQSNGDEQRRLASNFNLSFANVHARSLLLALPDLALSTSAACLADSQQPSYVLQALKLSPQQIDNTIRLSLGRFTTAAEVDKAGELICRQVRRLQDIAACSDIQ